MKFTVLFDSTEFIVISKAYGVDFHGEQGIVAILRDVYPEVFGIHRLDKDTSGVMVFAKNKEAQSELSLQFQNRKTQKVYFAYSDQRPKKKQGLVKGDIIPTRNGSYKLTRTMENPSSTSFKSFYLEEQNLRGFVVKPLTGKTHQIRVVLKSLGSPILGDKRYGGSAAERMYLHAYFLSFSLNGESYEFKHFPLDPLFEAGRDNFLDSV